jgi:diguanylate cyclase (GGDEF)-like protein
MLVAGVRRVNSREEGVLDWSKIPDILAVTSLACAFFSIVRRDRTPAHRLWLVGWSMIVLHFFAFMFLGIPGVTATLAAMVGLIALVAAGICFMWATVPSETQINSRRMGIVTYVSTSLYLLLASLPHAAGWAFDLASIFIALGPLAVGLFYRRYSQHALRWLTVGFHFALGAELLVLRRQSGGDPSLGVNAILFVIYMGCCIYFWYSHREGTTGSIITIGGFFAWSSVFVVAPSLNYFRPNLHLESEIWNLPKYVVAIGMLLLVLEKQIERSQYLALHDDLTALANRRLFQDRLMTALERARRAGTSLALLQIDLDRFKEVNDTYGHHIGDLLLRHVSSILETRVRRSDTVARTGGDEFSVILEEPNRKGGADLVAESLIKTLSEPFELDGHRVHIGASIGISIFPDDGDDPEALCIAADMKMYKVKEEHKGTKLGPASASLRDVRQQSMVS